MWSIEGIDFSVTINPQILKSKILEKCSKSRTFSDFSSQILAKIIPSRQKGKETSHADWLLTSTPLSNNKVVFYLSKIENFEKWCFWPFLAPISRRDTTDGKKLLKFDFSAWKKRRFWAIFWTFKKVGFFSEKAKNVDPGWPSDRDPSPLLVR